MQLYCNYTKTKSLDLCKLYIINVYPKTDAEYGRIYDPIPLKRVKEGRKLINCTKRPFMDKNGLQNQHGIAIAVKPV